MNLRIKYGKDYNMKLNSLKRTDFNFWTKINTRWRDMDALGHINHATYLSYMESARVDLYMDLGYSGIRKEMDESTILASMEVSYLKQASHPSTLDVGHRISRVGKKSFDTLSGIFFHGKDQMICSAIFHLVSFNYGTNQTILVPDIIRKNCIPFNDYYATNYKDMMQKDST